MVPRQNVRFTPESGHRVLKQALKKAVEWRILVHNPADVVKPPKVDRKPMATYDLAQTGDRDASPTRMFIPALLGVLCGLRRGEIVALRWDDVNLDAQSLSVVQSAEQTKDLGQKRTSQSRVRSRLAGSPSLSLCASQASALY